MATSIKNNISFIEGISDSEKSGGEYSFAFNRATDFRTDPTGMTILPQAKKDSGTLIEDLPMWGARACSRIFSVDRSGNIYKKESGVWSKEHVAADSVGNGLAYFGEDRSLYYAQNTTFGRLIEACTGNEYTDDILGAEGGEATNTKSFQTLSASSQYAYVADSAQTSITGDLSLEAYRYFSSLPAEGAEMVLMSKWNENGNNRSYKFSIVGTSSYRGDGRDGAKTVSTNETDDPVDANFTGSQGNSSFTVSNAHASFSAISQGDKALIVQVQGTNAGVRQFVDIESYSGGTVTISQTLDVDYSTSGNNVAYIMIMPQYTTITIDAGVTLTGKAWDGAKGGFLGYYLSDDGSTIAGIQTVSGKGFRGGLNGFVSVPGRRGGQQGENSTGAQAYSTAAAGNGGGGGGVDPDSSNLDGYAGIGGAGAHSRDAADSEDLHRFPPGGIGGDGGNAVGASDLSTIFLGGGGGGGGVGYDGVFGLGDGGNGGGVNIIVGDITITGALLADGQDGENGDKQQGPGGPGSGGTNLIIAEDPDVGTGLVSAVGGAIKTVSEGGGIFSSSDSVDGRNAIYYLNSVTGTTTPTAEEILDNTLSSTTGYGLRLSISDDGTAVETYTQDITEILSTEKWNRWQVTWDASTSTASFSNTGALIGTKTGSMTSIYDSTANFAVNASYDSAGNPENFFNGLSDDDRLWNDIRTQSELVSYSDTKLIGNNPNLVLYYEYENDVTDSQTDGLQDMTAVNAPTYSDNVPFIGLTSRNDQDQSNTAGSFGSTVATSTTISENVTDRIAFVPDYDPQKSFLISVDTIGSGDWTITIHDAKNRTVATSTITNANMTTGFVEFEYSSVFRPVIGATYHAHITTTVADGAVDVTTGEITLSDSNANPSAYFITFYQFLVSDQYHPMTQFLNFLAIGNERYLAILQAGDIYNPKRLTLPSGERIRCFAFWREFLVIGTWSGTDITDKENGKLFFWNGISDTYDYWIDVPEGGVNTMFGTRDILYLFAGYTGELLIYGGGGRAEKAKRLPFMTNNKYIEMAPGSMTMWRTLLTFGVNLKTDSTAVHKGVYTYGTKNRNYPDSLGFSYPLSIGDQTGTDVNVGMVFPSGQDLYIGWENNNVYAIDKVSVTNDPYASGRVETKIYDVGNISADKLPITISANHEALRSGESISIYYRADRESSWTLIDTNSTAGSRQTRATVARRMYEFQVAVVLATTVSTSPKLLSVNMEAEFSDERRI